MNRPFKKEGEQQQADFINGVVWRKPAENLANYMKKGSQIGVDGRVQTRTYEGQDGKTVYVTEVVADSIQFLESKGNQGSDNQGSYSQGNSGMNSQPNVQPGQNITYGGGEPIDISDDDLPF